MRSAHGIAEERVWLDPGIGFGKTLEHNLELLRRLDEIVALGRPVVVGVSRKRFIGSPHGPCGGRPRWRAASRPTCWHSSAEPTCSGCTTSAETRDALAVAAATVGDAAEPIRD